MHFVTVHISYSDLLHILSTVGGTLKIDKYLYMCTVPATWQMFVKYTSRGNATSEESD
jgi:hypothetical protein